MRAALENAGLKPEDIDYINTHGTATPTGDPVELEAIRQVFGNRTAFNSTKAMTGHTIGAAGAVELILTSIMMENNFICPSLNVDKILDDYEDMNIVLKARHDVNIRHALSNSFGFGGQNASVVLSSCD